MEGDASKTNDAGTVPFSETDYARIMSLMPQPKTTGRPRSHDMRPIMEALRHKLFTGCAWRCLPPRFPPWQTVYGYYSQLKDSGVWPALRRHLTGPASGAGEASRGSRPFRSPEEIEAILERSRDTLDRARDTCAKARLTRAARRKYAVEAAERLERLKSLNKRTQSALDERGSHRTQPSAEGNSEEWSRSDATKREAGLSHGVGLV